MFGTLQNDLTFIKNKYHDTSKPYDSYNRFNYVGYVPQNETGLNDEQMQEGLKQLAEAQSNLPHPIAKANAFKFVTDNSLIDINEHDYFVCFHSWRRPLRFSYFNVWHEQSFNKIPEVRETMRDLNNSGAVAIWPDYDHVIPNWDDLLSLGFAGILERAEKYKEMHRQNGTLTEEVAAFFDGIIIEYNAILSLIDRYIAYGEAHKNEKSEDVVGCLKNIRNTPPSTTYEALQVMYIYFLACECIDHYQTRSFGNGFDSTLYKFYKSDIERGRYSKDEIAKFLAYFFMQFSAIDNYWGHPLYLGGTDINGNSLYNEFSMLCLEVYEKLNIQSPKIQIKVNYNTPDDLLYKALDMVRKHNSSLVFICEPGTVKSMFTYGVPYEEAYDFEISGCYETRVKYNESSGSSGYINLPKALRYVFTNGLDERIGKQIGLKTGALENYKTFADFNTAFLKQVTNLIDISVDVTNKYELDLAEVNPSAIYSATVEGALKKGVDGYSTGVKYCNSNIMLCGFATAIDCAMAVKEFVYDKKLYTLDDFLNAIENNWQGYEELYALVKHSRLKYGNGVNEADRYASGVSKYITSSINNRKNSRGGVYKATLHTAMQFVWQGEKTGATPDGRKYGEEISKNASPSIGMDREGVTALIKSATETEPQNYPESFCLDVMLHPSSVAGDDGLKVLKTLIFTYMKKNGTSIQFNIFDVETLKDAQAHPEKYENLQVRICGWNILWNNIPKVQQDAYIERAQNIAQ